MWRTGPEEALARTSSPRSKIADDFGGIVVDAPRGQQRLQIRRMIGHRCRHGIGGVLSAQIRAGSGIEQQQHSAAAHDELIDGVKSLGLQLFRMDQHQDIDILVDVIEIRGQCADGEQLLQLSVDRPGLAHLSGLGIELSLQTD